MSDANIHQQRLSEALRDVQEVFELSDEQIGALPALDEIDLIPQNDSHFIIEPVVSKRTAHPFKLFIGQSNGDAFHVYLFKQSRTQQMKIEICSVDEEGGSYPLVDPIYFATVDDLAYPFNEWEGANRFVAAVKFYFLLGHKIGLYEEDPGFMVNKSWRRDLQGACDDLIKANKRMVKEKRAEETAKTRKQRAQTTPPQPLPETRPQARQPLAAETTKDDMGNERVNEYGQDWRRLSPHHGAKYQGYPPPFHGAPPDPPPGYYPPPHNFRMALPAYFAPTAGYDTPPPPSFYHTPDFGPPHHPASDQYVADGIDTRGDASHLEPPENTIPLPKPRKKGGKKTAKLGIGMPGSVKPEERSETPNQKLKAKSQSQSSHSVYQLDSSTLMAERTGVEKLPPARTNPTDIAGHDQTSLEQEYLALYRQREDIQARMDTVKERLPAEEYQALVKRIEHPQLAKLKQPSRPAGS